ncbi:NADH dehydrogenase subunit 3 (mitochondrion) [Nilaparvata lugens]|uniref:NADH-ubiquinone oxidoreductase chain 3 n=1 Tax=Nilaparvata lugens TaxID=108931 RepID=S4THL4_NILLU|nr:NADH dehydrogenase subunit 3 [Nilaparvata lugens]AGC22530.1 NADH dehydrogenase subunit 3 [Nilaparvata lugens]QCX31903.1 NADH dehydrogenase subunit 3 [Nilaparvata lugens]QDB64020.1 NADH dehydrogenase subunit 3 [Nilaparvata lugens]UVW80327.1 NADH-ubiquinone oxidoreductase chain 3 [Nilaparvata lugens]WCO86521.1 NADH dehydrogenase subunit 3 [Nilaparvata lugens]
MKMFMSLLMIMFLLILLMSTSFLISKKSIMDINKSSPFECGFSNFSSSRISFSIHFFMIAIIFIMFDIEMAIMLPIFISMKLMTVKKWFTLSMLICMLILYGLYHEWMNGIIEWSK